MKLAVAHMAHISIDSISRTACGALAASGSATPKPRSAATCEDGHIHITGMHASDSCLVCTKNSNHEIRMGATMIDKIDIATL